MMKQRIRLLMLTLLCALTIPAWAANPKVLLETTQGNIVIELDEAQAPLSVANFLRYVDQQFYDGLQFHRVIAGFMIQGGGFTAQMEHKNGFDPIKNESFNRLSNRRGTIAMARTSDPDSATSQFYINLVDNLSLDARGSKAGYAVFGHVVEGIEVVDTIAKVPTTIKSRHRDVPVEPVLIKSARRLP